MEIKKKLTVLRGEGGRDNRGKMEKGHQGICTMDPWTKPKWDRIEGGCAWGGGDWWMENGDYCN